MQFSALSCCTTRCLLFVQEHTMLGLQILLPRNRLNADHFPSLRQHGSVLLGTCLLLWLCTLFPLKNFAPMLMGLKGTKRKLLVEQGLTQICQSACHTILDAKLTARMNLCHEIEKEVYHSAVWTSRWQMQRKKNQSKSQFREQTLNKAIWQTYEGKEDYETEFCFKYLFTLRGSWWELIP